MSPALTLAQWIMEEYPYGDPMTHLKLQKLTFYCVGAALAFDAEDALCGDVLFQPWKHGPVNKHVWLEFKKYGANELPPYNGPIARPYPSRAARPMRWALEIYGALDAWSLRQQSHLERPWIDAYNAQKKHIAQSELKRHFTDKFTASTVKAPEHVQDPGTFVLDCLPVIGYSSMEDLAESIYAMCRRAINNKLR
jgi:uncharacterized phage-associated protein